MNPFALSSSVSIRGLPGFTPSSGLINCKNRENLFSSHLAKRTHDCFPKAEKPWAYFQQHREIVLAVDRPMVITFLNDNIAFCLLSESWSREAKIKGPRFPSEFASLGTKSVLPNMLRGTTHSRQGGERLFHSSSFQDLLTTFPRVALAQLQFPVFFHLKDIFILLGGGSFIPSYLTRMSFCLDIQKRWMTNPVDDARALKNH